MAVRNAQPAVGSRPAGERACPWSFDAPHKPSNSERIQELDVVGVRVGAERRLVGAGAQESAVKQVHNRRGHGNVVCRLRPKSYLLLHFTRIQTCLNASEEISCATGRKVWYLYFQQRFGTLLHSFYKQYI